MTPACTGPTATSWTSPPSTRKNGPLAGRVARGARTGLSHGCPSGVIAVLLPDLAFEQVRLGVRAPSAPGTRRAIGVLRPTASVLSASNASTATSRWHTSAGPSGTPNNAAQPGARSSSALVSATNSPPATPGTSRPRQAGRRCATRAKGVAPLMARGTAWPTAAVHASCSGAGVNNPSHSDRASSTSGREDRSAVSANRRLSTAPLSRPAVDDREDQARHAEECQQQAAEEDDGREPVARPQRHPHHSQLAEERTERRAGRDGEHAGHEQRRRARRERSPRHAPRPPMRAPAARRMLAALRNSAPLVRALVHT